MKRQIKIIKHVVNSTESGITYYLSVVGIDAAAEQISKESFELIKDALKMEEGECYDDGNGTSYPYLSK